MKTKNSSLKTSFLDNTNSSSLSLNGAGTKKRLFSKFKILISRILNSLNQGK